MGGLGPRWCFLCRLGGRGRRCRGASSPRGLGLLLPPSSPEHEQQGSQQHQHDGEQPECALPIHGTEG
ncbi:Hypothetical protein AA314_08878 [Archangium gephyra]|uniref:Uncharacterized protein n=1 Tax=Archangium gephyra TaxID=48 RepID=A0AAC8QGC2_9BACT|nr:Hypothetical protein AA314_08878 [Archangium gephyra]